MYVYRYVFVLAPSPESLTSVSLRVLDILCANTHTHRWWVHQGSWHNSVRGSW